MTKNTLNSCARRASATANKCAISGRSRIQTLIREVLDATKSPSAAFFERLVVDLLVRMGYGRTRKDAGQAAGRIGDGGIDGIINEDRLGLDIMYIQAKK